MKKRLGEAEYYFAITLKEGGKVIGEIDATRRRASPMQARTPHGTPSAPAGMLNEAYQGQGYAFEAAQAFFAYGNTAQMAF